MTYYSDEQLKQWFNDVKWHFDKFGYLELTSFNVGALADLERIHYLLSLGFHCRYEIQFSDTEQGSPYLNFYFQKRRINMTEKQIVYVKRLRYSTGEFSGVVTAYSTLEKAKQSLGVEDLKCVEWTDISYITGNGFTKGTINGEIVWYIDWCVVDF